MTEERKVGKKGRRTGVHPHLNLPPSRGKRFCGAELTVHLSVVDRFGGLLYSFCTRRGCWGIPSRPSGKPLCGPKKQRPAGGNGPPVKGSVP